MLITAKFNGRCAACGKPTPRGSDIDYIDKKAYHPGCVQSKEDAENAPPNPTDFAETDRLGFLVHGEALAHDWHLFPLPSRDREPAARGPESTTRPQPNTTLFK